MNIDPLPFLVKIMKTFLVKIMKTYGYKTLNEQQMAICVWR